MSFSQILERVVRLVRTGRLLDVPTHELHRAQALIDAENERDRRGRAETSQVERAEAARLRRVLAAMRALGVEPPTTLHEATRAWRRALLLVHPDTNGALDHQGRQRAEARTRELNEAYAIVKEFFNG